MLRLFRGVIGSAQRSDPDNEFHLDSASHLGDLQGESTQGFSSCQHHKILHHLLADDGISKKLRSQVATIHESLSVDCRETFTP